MKDKLMILLAALALMMSFTACNSEDDPEWKKRDVTFNTSLMNHVYDFQADKVYDLSTTPATLVFHRKDNTGDITLVPGDALPGVTLQINGAKFELDEDSGRYIYKATATSNSRVTDMTFVADFNEQSLEAHYTVDGHMNVSSQLPQVFFLSNSNKLSYSNGTDSIDNTAVYQFDINTKAMTATMHMGPLTNTKLLILFENIIARNIPFTVTKDGLVLESPAPETVSVYGRIDKKEGTYTTTDARDEKGYQKFPIVDFKATLFLNGDVHETTFKMGRDDESTKWSVKATGKRYLDSKYK